MNDEELEPIRKQLGIASWRELSKNHLSQLISSTPRLSSEALKSLVELAPTLKVMAKDALDSVQDSFVTTVSSNDSSNKASHDAFVDARRILESELSNSELGAEQRTALYSAILESAKLQADKDSENKTFLQNVFNSKIAAVAAITLGLVVVSAQIAGGKKPIS